MLKKILLIVYLGVISFCFAQSSNYSLQFNGTTDYVAIPHNDILNVSKVTIEFWVYWDGTTSTEDVDFVTAKAVEQLEVHTNGGSGDHGLRFIPTSHLFYDTNPNVFVSNTWTHVAFSYDPTGTPKATCYINGVLVSLTKRGDGLEGAPIITSTNELRIGKRGDGSYLFKGKLDEVRIWSVVRTQAQIQANKDIELSGNEAGLIAYYKMNEGSGSSITDNKASGTLTGTIYGATYQSGFPITELPVELCSFSADCSVRKVELNWETATEINNYGFEVQRSKIVDKNNFETLAFVEGNGNSNSPKSYSYLDLNVEDGKYLYRLKQIDNDGAYKYSDIIEVNISTTPADFELSQNFPNPFNPSTTIKFSIPSNQYVTLKVYDLLGKEVVTLFDENLNAGTYQKEFNANHLASGMYLYKLQSGQFTSTKKLLLLK